MGHIWRFLIIIGMVGFISGCTYQVKDLRYLSDSTTFNRMNLPDLKIYTPALPEEMPEPYVISVYDVQVAGNLRGVPHVEEYTQALSQELYQKILYGHRRATLITRNGKNNDNYLYRKHRIFEIKSQITELKTGSGWLRYLVGFGAGDVYLQWEGTITDASDGKTILAFAAGDRHNGDPNMAWNVKVFSDRYTVRKAFRRLMAKVLPELRPVL